MKKKVVIKKTGFQKKMEEINAYVDKRMIKFFDLLEESKKTRQNEKHEEKVEECYMGMAEILIEFTDIQDNILKKYPQIASLYPMLIKFYRSKVKDESLKSTVRSRTSA